MRNILLIIILLFSCKCFGQQQAFFINNQQSSTPPAPFSPRDSSGLLIWFKADTLSLTLADNDPISTWYDASGNANNATQTGTARPTFKTNQQNSQPGVLFTSAGLQFFLLTTLVTSVTPYSLFFVYKKATSGSQFITLSTSLSSTPYAWIDYTDANTYIFNNAFPYYSGAGGYASFTTISDVVSSGGVPSIWVNGSSSSFTVASSSGNNINWNSIGLNGALGFSDGTLLELIYYDHSATSTLRASVEGYLRTKYATW